MPWIARQSQCGGGPLAVAVPRALCMPCGPGGVPLGKFIPRRQIRKKGANNVKKVVKEIIAFRKACKATGTGLSHYILMVGKVRK